MIYLLGSLGGVVSIAVAIVLSVVANVAGDDFNVLMIGNSYVQGNSTARDVSLDVQGIFNADLTHTGSVTKRAVGGWSLKTHAESSITTNLITNFATYQWDAIVLQEQSNRPGRAIKFADSQLTNLDLGGPLLTDLIKQHQPQASVVLYNSWSKFPGHDDLVNYFNDDVDEMLNFTNQGYDRIREHPGSWNHTDVTTIARVGDAWDQWYDTYGSGNTHTRLHRPDGSHQNELGGYLAASVIYEQITGSTTIGNSYSGAVNGNLGDDTIVSLLQQQSSAVTGVAALDSADFNGDQDVDGVDFLIWQRGFGLTESAELADGDANRDFQVDNVDLSIWQQQFHEAPTTPAALHRVPEPRSAALLVSLAIFIQWLRATDEPHRLPAVVPVAL